MHWDPKDPADEREAKAAELLGAMLDLRASDGWQHFIQRQEITMNDHIEDLIQGRSNDDQLRGRIQSIREAIAIPDAEIKRANSELSKHRGT
jgi:hypothetical protein